jgi:hypothetical protein
MVAVGAVEIHRVNAVAAQFEDEQATNGALAGSRRL